MTGPIPQSSPGKAEAGTFVGLGSTSILPPADYWESLAGVANKDQIEVLRRQSDKRLGEFIPDSLPPPGPAATELLERVAADGWLQPEKRRRCCNCDFELDPDQAAQLQCPECEQVFDQCGGVLVETVYVRHLAPSRNVEWVVAIHGMNTRGAWQEAFSWLLATTWGRSVPVAIYKYGKVITGVLLAFRRRKLQRTLRERLVGLRDEARAQGFTGKPDVIAHSFGTWLLGHLLEDELDRDADERLHFGRIILTGCVLPPDFDWKAIQGAKLAEEVLNHYGTRDRVVPLAHATIWDSGPSGRRGFDSSGDSGGQVYNVRAEQFGHSDLFSIDKYVVNGQPFQKNKEGGTRHLDDSYQRAWRPFLTLPSVELGRLPNRVEPATPWRPLSWPLRGTLFPFLALPLVLGSLLLLASLGEFLGPSKRVLAVVVALSGAGLVLLLGGIAMTKLWRRLRRRRD